MSSPSVIPDAILLLARSSMRIIDFNDTACHMFGYSREELLKLAPSVLGEGALDDLESTYDRLIAGDKEHGIGELKLRRKDGSQFPAEVQRRVQSTGEGWIIVLMIRAIEQQATK